MPKMQWKNRVLIAASLLFYAMGQPLFLLLLLGSAYLNFYLAQRISPKDKGTLVFALVCNLFALGIFKYLDFFLGIFGVATPDGGVILSIMASLTKGVNALFGTTMRAPTSVIPIGISFYTFQVISYLVDVYRGKSCAQTSFSKLLLYLCMFPKMMQGPIVRYEQVEKQLSVRKTNPKAIFEGAVRFTVGLAKKVLLADYAGKVIAGLSSDISGASVVGAWLGAILFMFQLYFDFSGYSDMAIGLGRIFGFRYPENFNLPYVSGSITEFWRRWHMSLSSFFRDYVYIPLGGNRKGKGRQVFNMLVVWSLTGLWHGANWNYIIWGLYFFALLSIEKQILPRLKNRSGIVKNLVTMFFVLIGWVIFSHENLGELGSALANMFGASGFVSAGVGTRLMNTLPLLLVCLVGSTMIPRWISFVWGGIFSARKKRRGDDRFTLMRGIYALSLLAFAGVLLYLCTVSLVGSTSAPSIYANF
jgi:alginate O-acetyltransferase complex protein AlgI